MCAQPFLILFSPVCLSPARNNLETYLDIAHNIAKFVCCRWGRANVADSRGTDRKCVGSLMALRSWRSDTFQPLGETPSYLDFIFFYPTVSRLMHIRRIVSHGLLLILEHHLDNVIVGANSRPYHRRAVYRRRRTWIVYETGSSIALGNFDTTFGNCLAILIGFERERYQRVVYWFRHYHNKSKQGHPLNWDIILAFMRIRDARASVYLQGKTNKIIIG